MKVRAIEKGFYEGIKKIGDKFILEKESLFSSKWMVKIEEPVSDVTSSDKKKKAIKRNEMVKQEAF